MATEKKKRGRPKLHAAIRRTISDTDIAEYTDKVFWLNNATLSFFQALEDAAIPQGLNTTAAEEWRQMFKKVSLEMAPLVAQQTELEMTFRQEASKPNKPARNARDAILDEVELASRLGVVFRENLLAQHIEIEPQVIETLVHSMASEGARYCTHVRSDTIKQFNGCKSVDKLIALASAINSLASSRSKIQSPMREEALSAQRLLTDALLTKTIKDIVGPISAWAYYRLSVMLNSHWGRLSIQTIKTECEAYARSVGQLEENKMWSFEDGVYPVIVDRERESKYD